jgi:hypothetical protein
MDELTLKKSELKPLTIRLLSKEKTRKKGIYENSINNSLKQSIFQEKKYLIVPTSLEITEAPILNFRINDVKINFK